MACPAFFVAQNAHRLLLGTLVAFLAISRAIAALAQLVIITARFAGCFVHVVASPTRRTYFRLNAVEAVAVYALLG